MSAVSELSFTKSIDLSRFGFNRIATIPSQASSLVPARDQNYVFNTEHTDPIVRWWFAQHRTKSLNIVGPTRCGKTSVITQLCAELNWPVFVLPVHGDMRPEEFEGSMGVDFNKGGSTFELSPALKMYRDGGCLVLDEGNRANDALRTYLNAIAEGRPFPILATGEVIAPHPMFRLVMLANAGSDGDITGRFTDSHTYCVSFASRFRNIKFSEPDNATLKKIIQKQAPDLRKGLIDRMIKVRSVLRVLSEKGDSQGRTVRLPFSVGSMIDWALAMQDEYSDSTVGEAFNVAYMDGISDEGEINAIATAVSAVEPSLMSESVTEKVSLVTDEDEDEDNSTPTGSSGNPNFQSGLVTAPEMFNASDWTVLRYQDAKSDKVWACFVDPEVRHGSHHLTAIYGPYGQIGGKKQHKFATRGQMDKKYNSVIKEKMGKGYEVINGFEAESQVHDFLERMGLSR